MEVKKPCNSCPFIKGKAWYGSFGSAPNAASKLEAFTEAERQQIFSCHVLHPDRNIFSLRDMEVDDCAGFRMMKENMISKNTHPEVVNNFDETGPDGFSLKYWAMKEGFNTTLL